MSGPGKAIEWKEPAPHMVALEPRVLLDAAAVETALDASGNAHAALADAWLDGQRGTDAPGERQIAFVFSDVGDADALVEGLPPAMEIVRIDAGEDGLAAMRRALDGRTGLSAIHVLSHGAEGRLSLGTATMDAGGATARAADWAAIGAALSERGDLLLYGCDVASAEGRGLAGVLAELTGADVAASDDPTGAAALGGDWDLEVVHGTVEAETLSVRDWNGTLAVVVAENTSASGSVNDESVRRNDPIGQTFTLGSAGDPDVAVDEVQLLLKRNGDPGYSVTVELSTSYEGAPIVSVAQGTSAIGSTYEWVSFAFPFPIDLAAGTTYWLTVTESDGVTDLDLRVGDGGAYGGGSFVDNNGTPEPSQDAFFRILGPNGTATNTPPVIRDDTLPGVRLFSIDENETFVANVVADDLETPGSVTYHIVGGGDASRFAIDETTGVLTLLAGADFENLNDADGFGDLAVRVEARDGAGGTDQQLLDVYIDDVDESPVTDDAQGFSIRQGETGFVDVLAGDFDPEGTALTVTQVNGVALSPTGWTDVGDVSVRWNSGRLELQIDATGAATGPLTLTYTVEDSGGLAATGTADGTILPGSQAPDGTDNTVTVGIGVDRVLAVSDFPFTDADVPADRLREVRIASTILLGNGDLLLLDAPGGAVVAQLTAGDTIRASELQSGRIVFRPDAGVPAAGALFEDGSVDVTIVDDGSGASEDPNTTTITFRVARANVAPVAEDDTFYVFEDDNDSFRPLDNDRDDDGDAFTITHIDGAAIAAGTTNVAPIRESTAPGAPIVGEVRIWPSGQMRLTPLPDYEGPFAFTYTITGPFGAGDSDTGTVSGTILAVPDRPVAGDDGFTTTEDTGAIALDLLANDTDVDRGDTLAIVAIDGVAILPGEEVAVSRDGTPVSRPEEQVGVVSMDAGGGVSFTPDADYFGDVVFSYTVRDSDGLESVADVLGRVNGVADDPVARDDAFGAVEDGGSVSLLLLGNDTDADGDTLAIVAVDGQPLVAGGPPIAVRAPGAAGAVMGFVDMSATGTVRFTPAPDRNGAVSFRYTVTDGTGRVATATANGTVAGVGDSPLAIDDALPLLREDDDAVAVSPLDNDLDPDGEPLRIASVAGVAVSAVADTVFDVSPDGTRALPGEAVAGTVTVRPDGTVLFRPAPDFFGPVLLPYSVADPGGETGSALITGQVDPVDDRPVLVADAVAATEDGDAVVLDLLGNDRDVDDALVLAEVAGIVPASGAVVELAANGRPALPGEAVVGTLRFDGTDRPVFRPAPDFNGVVRIEYRAEGGALSDTSFVDVAVEGVDDPSEIVLPAVPPLKSGETFVWSAANGTAIAVSDRDAGDVAVRIAVANGRFENVDPALLRDGGRAVEIVGRPDAVSAALDGLLYRPDVDFGGTERLDLASWPVSLGAGTPETRELAFEVSEPSPPPPPPTTDEGPTPPAPQVEGPNAAPPEEEENGDEQDERQQSTSDTEATGTDTGTTPAPALPGRAPGVPVVAPPAPVSAEAPPPAPEPPVVALPLAPEPRRSEPVPPPGPTIELPAPPDYGFETLDRPGFGRELSRATDDVRDSETVLGASVDKVSFAFGSLLSVGGVSWLLRGGALGAAVLSAMPAWRRFDPIAVVGEEGEDAEGSSDAAVLRDRLSRVRDRVGDTRPEGTTDV